MGIEQKTTEESELRETREKVQRTSSWLDGITTTAAVESSSVFWLANLVGDNRIMLLSAVPLSVLAANIFRSKHLTSQLRILDEKLNTLMAEKRKENPIPPSS